MRKKHLHDVHAAQAAIEYGELYTLIDMLEKGKLDMAKDAPTLVDALYQHYTYHGRDLMVLDTVKVLLAAGMQIPAVDAPSGGQYHLVNDAQRFPHVRRFLVALEKNSALMPTQKSLAEDGIGFNLELRHASLRHPILEDSRQKGHASYEKEQSAREANGIRFVADDMLSASDYAAGDVGLKSSLIHAGRVLRVPKEPKK